MRLMILMLVWLLVTPASLLGTVGGILSAPFRKAADVAGAAWHAIRGLFSVLKSVFVHVWDATADSYRALHHLAVAAADTATQLAALAAHLLIHAIPDAAHWALREATHVASVLVATAEHVARVALHSVQRDLRALVHSVWVRLTGWVRTIERTVTWTWRWLNHGGIRAVDLVLHPTHLVAWILPHLLGPVWRFILSNIEGLSMMVWRTIRGHEDELAHDLEAALVRLVD